MHPYVRKFATSLLVVAVTLFPMLSEAAQYQYFRMYGHGGLISTPPGGQTPQGDLSYQITGASAATVGQPYAATSSVAGAVGATVFFVQSGSLAPGLSLDLSTGVIRGTPTKAGFYPVVLGVRDALNSQGFAALNLTTNSALMVSGSSSAIGTVGTAYAAQFVASGGSAPYVFSTTSTLPPGLSLSQNGLLTGVPSLAGDFQNIVVHVLDAAGGSVDSTAFAIKIAKPLAVAWEPASGKVGIVYAASLPQATGGNAPYVYSLNGQVPNGLTFNNATGAFAGTPATAGTYSVGVTVVDSDGRLAQSGAGSLVIASGQVVDPAGPLALAGSPPATAQIGIGYTAHFTASGGTQTGYLFDLAAGVLPPGLSLGPVDGTITGAPNALGTYSAIQVRVTDSAAETALSGPFTITVAPQPSLIIAGNPSSAAQVGSLYRADFNAFDGTGEGYNFTSIGAALPPGLTLSNVGGASASLIGTPTFVGTYSGLQVRVTDSGGHTADSQTFSITVAPRAGNSALVIAGSPQRWADIGTPYSAGFSASGGTGGYTFTASGNVPLGLTMSADGILSGTPRSAGADLFSVQVMDSEGDTASASFTITVGQPLDLAVGSLPYGFKNADYSYQLTAFGGTQPYSYIQTGLLPSGVSLNAATGLISGKPATGGGLTYGGIVSVVDAVGRTIARNATMTVYDPLSVAFQPVSGAVGEPYLATPTVSGGAGGYTFSVKAFPSGGYVNLGAFGLTLDPSTGAISGVPTAAGVTPEFNYSVTDKVGLLASAPSPDGGFHMSIFIAGALSVTGSPSRIATTGQSYSASFSTAGGTGSPTFAVASGALPGWLTLNPTTGVLEGTPQISDVGMVGPLTVSVIDQGQGSASSEPFSISVATPPVLSGAPAVASLGSAYSFDLTSLTAGGRAPYSYIVTSGALPAGMGISGSTVTSSEVSGRTATAGITVTDTDGRSTFGSVTFNVTDATASAALTSSTVVRSGAVIAGSLTTTLPNATWMFASTPVGLNLTASGTSFSGVAPSIASAASYSVTATATAGSNSATAAPMVLTVAPVLEVSGGPSSDVSGDVGIALTATPAASVGSSGVGTISYSLLQDGSAVALSNTCPGLSFSPSTAVISGMPSATCSLSGLTIRATDAADGSSVITALPFAIMVNPAISAPSGNFASTATAGTNYSSGPLGMTGGTAPMTWSVASGTLPTGLVLDASTGVLSGLPTATGTFTFTVKRIDSLGQASPASSPQSVTVAAATFAAAPSTQAVHVGQPISGTFSSTFSAPAISVLQSPAAPDLALTATTSDWSGIAPTVGSQTTFSVTWTEMTPGGAYSKAATATTVKVYPALALASVSNFTGETGNSVSFVAPALSNLIGSATWTLLQNGSPVSISSLCGSMTFDSTTGRISSTNPAACSSTNLSYKVTDSADGTSITSSAFSITIGAAQAAPTGTLASTGIAGVAYSSGPLATHGGIGPYVWSIASGALPSGVTLNASTGIVSGNPTAQGSYNFTLRVTDAYSIASPASATQTVTITQTPSNNGTYTTTAQVGTPYSKAAPTTSGGPGTPPYVYHLFSGTIPPGLTLNTDGSLIGVPTTAGNYTFQVYLTDANGISSASAGTSTTIAVSGATASGALSAPTTVRSGAAFSGTLSTSRTAPVWTLGQSPASPSLSLAASGNTSSATFSGTAPSVASQTTFFISATATSGGTATNTGTIGGLTVNPPLSISGGPSGTVAGSVGNAISSTAAPSVSGMVGTATYALLQSGASITLSSTCAGLSFSASTGVISGTPSATCSLANLTIKVTDSSDSANAVTSGAFGIVISASLSAPTGSFTSSGMVGASYSSGPLSVSGGVTPYTWSLASGSLPSGLTLDPTSGILSGTPTAAGVATFTAMVTDAQGRASAASASQTVTIVAPLAVATQPSNLLSRVGTAMNSMSTGVVVTGGTGAYVWSISPHGAALPSGATIASATGAITWSTPVAGTTSGIKLRATDSVAGSIDTAVFSLTANPALTISGGPSGTISGVPSSAIAATSAPTVNNKVGSITYSLLSSGSPITLGSVCPGLTFHTDTGVIDGTPTATCSQSSLTIRATDSDGATAATQTSFTVVINPNLVITLGTVPSGATNTAYTYVPSVTGGTGTLSTVTTTNVTGTLASLGLSVSIASNQVKFSGTPTAAGSWKGTFTVTDSGGNSTTSAQFTITVTAALTLLYNVPIPSNTAVGGSFQATPSVSGGAPPYTYWIVNDASSQYTFGNLGLTFNPNTGVLSGPVTVANHVSTGVVGVTDSAGNQATKSISVSAAAPSANVFGGTMTNQYAVLPVNTAYSAGLTLTGGTTPYRYFLYSGTLPPGVTITQSSNTWSGTVTTAGQYTYVAQAGDANFNYFNSQTYYVTVYSSTSPQIAVSPNSQTWDIGQTGRTFSLTPYGSGPFTLQPPTTTSGTLPAGLSFVQPSGVASGAAAVVVSGTPTASGSWTGTFTAKDSGGRTTPAVTVTITVNASPTIAGTPPSGKVGTAYSFTPTLGGGTPYYTGFAAANTSGSTLAQLGLSISSTSGVITGTPTSAGTWNGTISYVDAMGQTATNTFSITVSP